MTDVNRIRFFWKWFNTLLRDPIMSKLPNTPACSLPGYTHLNSDMWTFFIDLEVAVEEFCEKLRKLCKDCIQENPGRYKIVFDANELRDRVKAVTEEYNDAIAKAWEILWVPQDSFDGLSLAAKLGDEDWFNKMCPEGLEEAIPGPCTIHSYIGRIAWPEQFEEYVRVTKRAIGESMRS